MLEEVEEVTVGVREGGTCTGCEVMVGAGAAAAVAVAVAVGMGCMVVDCMMLLLATGGVDAVAVELPDTPCMLSRASGMSVAEKNETVLTHSRHMLHSNRHGGLVAKASAS